MLHGAPLFLYKKSRVAGHREVGIRLGGDHKNIQRIETSRAKARLRQFPVSRHLKEELAKPSVFGEEKGSYIDRNAHGASSM